MIKTTVERIKNSQLARNTCWMLLGQVGGIVIQALYFLLIARSLRLQGYGAVIGVCALVGMLTPFSGLGTGNLLIKHVSRDSDTYRRSFGNAILMVLISGVFLLVVAMGVSQLVFPPSIPPLLVFLVAFSDLLFSKILVICEQAYQAFQRLERTALLQVIPNILKLLAIAGLSLCFEAPSVVQWGYLYLMTMVISALIGMFLVYKELGTPLYTLAGLWGQLREGFYFSVSQSSRVVYNDIDKTMLTRFSTLEATGIYGTAYRIINVAFTPILSLLFAAYSRFFKHGEKGVSGSLYFTKKIFPLAGGYGLLVGILLIVSSPIIPHILGAEYNLTVNALCLLAPLPFMKAVHLFAADTLTGAGYQGVRSGIQVIVAGFNVIINLWLIPAYSWRGAAWASIVSDGLLAILMCLAVVLISKKKWLFNGKEQLV